MKRIKLNDRILPNYTKGEEIFNMVSHIVGGALGIFVVIYGIVKAICGGLTIYELLSLIVFGITLILLYTFSSIYHGLSPKLKAKKVFQIFDHCTIFLLIAGTYTPFCLCTLMEYDFNTGIFMFFLVWLMAIIGIVFNAIDLKKYKVFSLICYLVMGWGIIIKTNVLLKLLGFTGFLLLLLGGLFYSVGVIFYVKGKKHKWFHSIFHIFCVIGSLLHVLAILLFVL